MPYLATILITLMLAAPVMSVELEKAITAYQTTKRRDTLPEG